MSSGVSVVGSRIFSGLVFGFYGIVILGFYALMIVLIILAIRALMKYLQDDKTSKEKAEIRKPLGETLKEHRLRCNMTQEFVAETVGVSRQAVSKWENGSSDPSTSNLLALAKLFGISAEELLKEVQE